MTNLQNIIETQLCDLGAFLAESEWHGRENELVNLFAHSFLAKEIDPARIGIEVAVKQLPGCGKKLVRKDLVIWNRPNETVWIDEKPINRPAAVIEFKVDNEAKCAPDRKWLCSFTRLYPGVVGYSVCGYVKKRREVVFWRVTNGTDGQPQRFPSSALSSEVS